MVRSAVLSLVLRTALICVCPAVLGCGNMVTRFLATHDAIGKTAASQWAKKRVLTINNATIGVLTDFPLPVFLDASRINYSLCQAAGHDLRFFDADGVTPLSYEIENWNAGGVSLIWIRVPQIDAGSTSDRIVMVYGNPTSSPASNSSAVWPSEYKGVYHMVNGNDSTTNANHATVISNVTYSTSGSLGGRGFFDAALTPHVTIPTSGLTLAQGTVEAVVEMRTAPTNANYRFAFSHTNTGSERLYVGSYNTGRAFFGTLGDNATGVTSATAYTLNALTHVSITYTGLNFTMYFNGVQTDTGSATGHTGILPTANIGNYGATPNNLWAWDGYIHEVRFLSSAKSSDYMKASHRAVTDAYVSFGAEQDN